MCGICGIFNKTGYATERDELKRMCDVMVHRGPDDEGYYTSSHVGLGMRRLKIIDLETGHQPIHNEDESIWVVLNGEIYNYRELRTGLEEKGHTFYTRSDTEVIVHLYEDHGEEFLEKLNGMFGLAIWDARTDRLIIARDRLGVKQLYYYEDDKRIVFGSEIKTILALPGISREIDYEALSDYFSLQYIPASRTIYHHIRKLPAACSLTIDKGRPVIRKYWTLNYDDIKLTGRDAIDTIDRELQRAIKWQMISDVPLGAYLSGGIDSSLLVAIMSTVSTRPVETFSIIWDTESNAFDERSYSRFVVEKYGTNHHEFLVKPEPEDVMEKIVRGFDEPFADDSAIPNYYIARETRKYVTVALSGLGGDEMSAGYERYLGMKLLKHYRLLPEKLRAVLVNIIHSIPDSNTGSPWVERMKRFARITDSPFAESYFAMSSKIDTAGKPSLFTLEAREKMGLDYSTAYIFYALAAECTSPDELNQMLYIDMNTYMVDQLLVLSDRMSMAHSLELRVPYLDHCLVECFARIDPSMKLHGFVKKYLLKKVAEKYFPESFIYRKKMGFSSPIVLWLRKDLKSYMLAILNKKSIEKTGILNPDTVLRYVHEHLERKHNHDTKLWSIMMFMLWYNTYIDKVYDM
ncbi:MAG TPA: asparagine synthase (glutamine-hydrolyzing) [Bacteroidales bacterium]|nr:asparagine synthase (glutamine-hydrolyzing) [Bacteroidales bacterium]